MNFNGHNSDNRTLITPNAHKISWLLLLINPRSTMRKNKESYKMSSSPCVLPLELSRLTFAILILLLTFNPVWAADKTITIELNKTEDTEQGCRPLFLFDNQSGHQLNRFQVELVLFDDKGVYSKQILLDMAPLYDGKKTVASFLLNDTSCETVGSMLVNDLPECEDSSGSDIDCLALLKVSSKSEISLEK